MKTQKITINPNGPGDMEENIDWEYYKNKKEEEVFELTVSIKKFKLFDDKCKVRGLESYRFQILDINN